MTGPDLAGQAVINGDAAVDESDRDRLTRQLLDEFRDQLEESLIRVIVGDFDLPAAYDEVRTILLSLAETALIEEDATQNIDLLEVLSQIEHVQLNSDGVFTNPETTSRPATSHSHKSELATSISDSSESPEPQAPTDFPDVEFEQKVVFLGQIFPDVKQHTVEYVLKRLDGDADRAIEELLTRSALEAEGKLPKGVDGFFRPDTSTSQRKGRPSTPQEGASRRVALPVEYTVVSSSSADYEIEDADGHVKSSASKSSRLVVSSGPSSGSTSPRLKPVQPPRLSALPPIAPATTELQPSASKDPYEWRTVVSKHKLRDKSAERAAPSAAAADAHAIAAEKRQIAKDHYLKWVAASRRAGSDPLYRQAMAVHAENGRAAAQAAIVAASASHDLLVDERATALSIDLHHLPVHDGVRIAKERVRRWWDALPGENRPAEARGSGGFTVITGQGRHNADGRSRLRRDVAAALGAEGWAFRIETGKFVVTGRAK